MTRAEDGEEDDSGAEEADTESEDAPLAAPGSEPTDRIGYVSLGLVVAALVLIAFLLALLTGFTPTETAVFWLTASLFQGFAALLAVAGTFIAYRLTILRDRIDTKKLNLSALRSLGGGSRFWVSFPARGGRPWFWADSYQ